MLNSINIRNMFRAMQQIMHKKKDYLIDLDSVAGDGDLGLSMNDGYTAAYNAVMDSEEKDIGKLLYTAGKAMATAAPSSMGTLMASGFINAAKELKNKEEIDLTGVYILFNAFLQGVMNRGKANLGEKTFLDGLAPAVEALKEATSQNLLIYEAVVRARDAAEKGFQNTKTMKAVHGRMAIRGEASRELLDPGAAIASLMMQAFVDSFDDAVTEEP